MTHADPARLQLITDAMSVLDLMDSQQPSMAVMDPAERRRQLITLVAEACQRGGRTYSGPDIEKAVGLWLEQQQPLVPVAPTPKVPLIQRMTQVVQRMSEGVQDWWDERSAFTRTMGVGTALSVGGALFLVLTPWISVIRAPFVMAATHGSLYCILLFAFLGICGALTKHGSDTKNENLAGGAMLVLVLSGLLGVIGGGVAAATAQGTVDADKMLRGFMVVDQAMDQAKAKLRPGAPLSDVVDAANALVMDNRGTYFRNVGDFNAKTGIIQRTGNFNPNECQLLTAQLSPHFHVVSVNGQAVGDGPLHCPFIWRNEVTIESKPGAF